MPSPSLARFLIAAADGREDRSFWGPGGDRYRFLVTGRETGGSGFVLEATVPPGGGPPPHIHHREDEFFYLLHGTLTVHVADRTFDVAAGDFVHAPRGITHHYRNNGTETARMLAIFTPSGMEHWFEECLVPVAEAGDTPPEPTPEFIAKMIEAGPRNGVEWG